MERKEQEAMDGSPAVVQIYGNKYAKPGDLPLNVGEIRFQCGPVTASVFVCGEFCGSRREANGAFYEPAGLYLDDPCAQLTVCA